MATENTITITPDSHHAPFRAGFGVGAVHGQPPARIGDGIQYQHQNQTDHVPAAEGRNAEKRKIIRRNRLAQARQPAGVTSMRSR